MATNLNVTGLASVSALNVSGASTFNGPVTMATNLNVTGLASVSALNVSGNSTFSGAVTINNTLNVTGLATFSSGLTSSSQTTVRDICETIYGTTLSGATTFTVSWLSGNIFYINPVSATNITLTITNLPTTTYSSFNFAVIINSGTYKTYITTVTLSYVGGTSSTPTILYNGGIASINVSSATVIIQTFNAINTSDVPYNLLTSISAFNA
jgi:hypothetical protein